MTMTTDAHIPTTRSAARATATEALQYRLFYGACFIVCLPFVALAWLMPGMTRTSGGDTSTTGRSIIGEAKSSAAVAAGYAFLR